MHIYFWEVAIRHSEKEIDRFDVYLKGGKKLKLESNNVINVTVIEPDRV